MSPIRHCAKLAYLSKREKHHELQVVVFFCISVQIGDSKNYQDIRAGPAKKSDMFLTSNLVNHCIVGLENWKR